MNIEYKFQYMDPRVGADELRHDYDPRVIQMFKSDIMDCLLITQVLDSPRIPRENEFVSVAHPELMFMSRVDYVEQSFDYRPETGDPVNPRTHLSVFCDIVTLNLFPNTTIQTLPELVRLFIDLGYRVEREKLSRDPLYSEYDLDGMEDDDDDEE